MKAKFSHRKIKKVSVPRGLTEDTDRGLYCESLCHLQSWFPEGKQHMTTKAERRPLGSLIGPSTFEVFGEMMAVRIASLYC